METHDNMKPTVTIKSGFSCLLNLKTKWLYNQDAILKKIYHLNINNGC